jgi:hypothetical protein
VGSKKEHPVTAGIGVAAIAAAMVAIFTAYLELHGTKEIDRARSDAPLTGAGHSFHASLQCSEEDLIREAAVTSSRWATGFSQ